MDAETEVVVASYGEDVSWVDRLELPVTIYDAKGTCQRPAAVQIENGGREAGQYIKHILAHYPDFPDFTIFMQGRPFDHWRTPINDIHRGTYRERSIFLFGPVMRFDWNNHHPHMMWARRFGNEWMGGIPVYLHWVSGAQFSVSRQVLQARALDYWQRLHDKVVSDPQAPWAIERLWTCIL